MIIQHNISALNSYNKLSNNNSSVSKNLQKLSSGYRINSAADDAAGLAISEKMRSQVTGLERAKLNAQDGISLVQTAEGALTEVHSMLNRLVELGTESANGTIQATDRQKIQDEVNALTEEIDRISQATNFNGINLLDGSLSGGATGKAGGLTGATVINYKAAQATTAYADVTAAGASELAIADETYVINGTEVKVEWSKLSDSEKSLLKRDWTNASTADKDAAAKLMQDTINAAITAAGGTDGVKVTSENAGFQIKSALSGTTNSSIKNTVEAGTLDQTGIGELLLGVPGADAAANATEGQAVNMSDANGKFLIVLDGEEFEVDMSGAGLDADSTAAQIVTELQNALNDALSKYDDAKGLTGDQKMGVNGANPAKIQVKMSNDGRLEFVNNSDKKMEFRDYEDKEYAKTLGISSAGKAQENGLTLQIGDTADDFNKVTVSIDDMSSSGLGIAGLRVTDQGLSADSIDKVNAAIEKVSVNRGRLGALQNRMEHTINNLSTTTENLTAAESRIRDTDMAKEMMNFTKNNVLVQAAQSMLAQANQQPQQVLQLLR